RNGVCPPEVVAALRQAAELAVAAGIQLLIRNAPECYTDTGAHTASIVHAVSSPALGASWDPCHAVRAGEQDICAGYEWLLPFVRDVCIKDQEQREELGYEYTVMAEGSMAWSAQLRALLRDGFQGTATLGSQLEPRLLNTMHSLDALQKLLRQVRAEAVGRSR
uniref:sugar phosphate isomerase/epimerase family protein n=1 Tax=Desulfovibrio sp. TaxID=885 RepID=UPI0026030B26